MWGNAASLFLQPASVPDLCGRVVQRVHRACGAAHGQSAPVDFCD